MRQVRDTEKQITRDEAMSMLKAGEYGVLSTVDNNGQPYGVPLNYLILDETLYMHCALEGHKLDNISQNPQVCFTVVGYSEIVPSLFTAKYESVVVFGKARLADEPEKVRMLTELVKKYSPQFQDKGMKVIDAFKDKCAVISIKIEDVTGMKKR